MKTAKTESSTLYIDTIPPSEIQGVYEKGKQGKLFCPVCSGSVKLYLGIHEAPYFYHASPGIPDCRIKEDSPQPSKAAAKPEYTEVNGFRLPASRTVTMDKEDSVHFKSSQPVDGNGPFVKSNSALPKECPDYFSALADQGFTLDPSQILAASTIDGPLLVLSGAGSGKTRVLTVRTAYMIAEKNIDPRSIMLVTFTAKAAREMEHRLSGYPGMDPSSVRGLVSGTFHSIFFRLLLFHQPERWQKQGLLKWDWERLNILKAAGRDLGLNEKDFAYDQALQQISLWKNSLRFPGQVQPKDDFEKSCRSLYQTYEEYKSEHSRYDFDDMLVGCYRMFMEDQDLLGQYQSRFQYFLVDEFQDINPVQYELIKLLSARNQNICAVGDDDQSIYSFRGSSPSFILEFEQTFKQAKVIRLAQNYRSSHQIVATANRIIKRNKQRLSKTMKAQHDHGPAPVLFYPYDEEVEATMIVTDLQEKIRQGANPGDFAILYRTHTMSRAVFERLAASSLPFAIEKDAESFYERRIVKSMLAYMKLACNPEDPGPLSLILSSMFMKQALVQELKAQTILQDCDFIEAFAHIKTGHAFQEKKLKMFPSLVRSLARLSPAAALEVIEKDLGFMDYVKKRGDEGSIEKGSDDIRDLRVAARKFSSVTEFLEHADHMAAMVKEIKRMSGHFRDAIQLTTIHRSKGLEYNGVYLLSAVDGSLPHDFALESWRKGDSAPLEEERRLMYVAATRARNELYISVPQTRRGRTAYPSRFLKI